MAIRFLVTFYLCTLHKKTVASTHNISKKEERISGLRQLSFGLSQVIKLGTCHPRKKEM